MSATVENYVQAIERGDLGLASFYGDQLDEPGIAAEGWVTRPEALRLSAIDYARRLGLLVLPLRPGSKIPLAGGCCGGTHDRGSLTASGNLAVVDRWWREHPSANIGIATGHRVDVIDQDGPEGALAYVRHEWPAVLGIALTVRPEGAGVHRYIAATGEGNGAGLHPGIDYRGRGGYVVAPPSIIEGRRYSWAQPLRTSGNR